MLGSCNQSQSTPLRGTDQHGPGTEATQDPVAEEAFRKQRVVMVEKQLKLRDISDKDVLETMLSVPRHEFVPEDYRELVNRYFRELARQGKKE